MIIKFSDFTLNESLKPSKIHKTKYVGDYKVLIGKNDKMNDILTFDIADKNDIWMHASGVPGSHIVIKLEGNDYPPKDILYKSAQLAAENSKSTDDSVKIVYTERKNVTKDSDHNPGKVNVDYEKSNFINIKKKMG